MGGGWFCVLLCLAWEMLWHFQTHRCLPSMMNNFLMNYLMTKKLLQICIHMQAPKVLIVGCYLTTIPKKGNPSHPFAEVRGNKGEGWRSRKGGWWPREVDQTKYRTDQCLKENNPKISKLLEQMSQHSEDGNCKPRGKSFWAVRQGDQRRPWGFKRPA